ncbi:MAG: S1C family serine protease, partial [Gemmatimonadaceae bacterium]
GYNAGYGFAIPITLAKRVMDEIIAHGRVRIPALGIQIDDVGPEDAAVAGVKDIRGVLVRNFPEENTPAQKAGLQPGDVIITGTPEGVGMGRKPPEWLKPGDVVELEIEKIGILRNHIERSA